MQAHDTFLPTRKPLLHGFALLLGQHLVEFVGAVQHQHVVAAEFLGTHVLHMLGHVHLEAVFVSEEHEPAIDLRNLGMAVVAGIGIHQHFETAAFGRCGGGFMAVGDAGQQEQGENETLHGVG